MTEEPQPEPICSSQCEDEYYLTPGQTVQFVWTYFHGAASADELRWSIRSVRQNFGGEVKILVIGDRPLWYKGPFINKPRIGEVRNQNFRDVISKMAVLATHDLVDPDFVWMMDDIYLLNPTTIEELAKPRCLAPQVDQQPMRRRKKWLKLKDKTAEALKMAHMPMHDFATHLPHVINKLKLSQTLSRFDFISQTLLWETLYENQHLAAEPELVGKYLTVVSKNTTTQQLDQAASESVWFNNGNEGWSPDMAKWLAARFPEKSPEEVE